MSDKLLCLVEVCVDEQNAREEHANSNKQRGDCVIEQLENCETVKTIGYVERNNYSDKTVKFVVIFIRISVDLLRQKELTHLHLQLQLLFFFVQLLSLYVLVKHKSA